MSKIRAKQLECFKDQLQGLNVLISQMVCQTSRCPDDISVMELLEWADKQLRNLTCKVQVLKEEVNFSMYGSIPG